MNSRNILDAIRLFREQSPDFVGLDMMMPGHSGCEVCWATRAIAADVPIIFFSAKAEFDILVSFEIGTDDFIVKPFSVRGDEVIELGPRKVCKRQLLHENSGRAMDRNVDFRHG